MDSTGETRMVTLQSNPLLLSPVIECVFEYLPLEDLKQCRVVCQEFNSVSIKILNKQSRVKLDSKERIANFLQFYKVCHTFPFTTFQLTFSDLDVNTKELEQVEDFFTTLRKNIITLECVRKNIFQLAYGTVRNRLCLTPLIGIATNLVGLTLSCFDSVVALDKLSKVKYLTLLGCGVSLDSFKHRIAPLSISLTFVRFERNENALQEILINDYIDFGGCSEIIISPCVGFVTTFDMARDIVSARKVKFERIRVVNWRETPAKLNRKMLPFEKYTGMRIKQLCISSTDEFNLSVLPKSIEKLLLMVKTYRTINCVPMDLPNLKYLLVVQVLERTTTLMSPTADDMGIIISRFRLCPKLVDVVLLGGGNDRRCDINVDLLPVNLKRIKLSDNHNIHLVGDKVTHVDILILESSTFAEAQRFLNKIKGKIVVVELEYCSERVEDPHNEIVSFVEESRNWEKIVLSIPEWDSELFTSYKTTLSNFVDDDDRKSTCYEFTNQVGKCLTREEFNMYWLQ